MVTRVYCTKYNHIVFSFAEIIVGFPYEEMTFDASAVGNATMLVFGEALQGFTVNYVHGISQMINITQGIIHMYVRV